jgi:hypothetical protein
MQRSELLHAGKAWHWQVTSWFNTSGYPIKGIKEERMTAHGHIIKEIKATTAQFGRENWCHNIERSPYPQNTTKVSLLRKIPL